MSEAITLNKVAVEWPTDQRPDTSNNTSEHLKKIINDDDYALMISRGPQYNSSVSDLREAAQALLDFSEESFNENPNAAIQFLQEVAKESPELGNTKFADFISSGKASDLANIDPINTRAVLLLEYFQDVLKHEPGSELYNLNMENLVTYVREEQARGNLPTDHEELEQELYNPEIAFRFVNSNEINPESRELSDMANFQAAVSKVIDRTTTSPESGNMTADQRVAVIAGFAMVFGVENENRDLAVSIAAEMRDVGIENIREFFNREDIQGFMAENIIRDNQILTSTEDLIKAVDKALQSQEFQLEVAPNSGVTIENNSGIKPQ